MRVAVERHELRFLERRLHGVVAAGLVRGVPPRPGWAGREVQRGALLCELGVVEGTPLADRLRVDLAGPALNGDAAVRYNAIGILGCTGAGMHGRHHERESDGGGERM